MKITFRNYNIILLSTLLLGMQATWSPSAFAGHMAVNTLPLVARSFPTLSSISKAKVTAVPSTINISTCQQLQNITTGLDASDAYATATYLLTADIDCSATSTWNSGKGFIPIGIKANGDFTTGLLQGTFNGQGHAITGLYINNPALPLAGLFGTAAGTIENLNLRNLTIYAATSSKSVIADMGGLVGDFVLGNIQNVTVQGNFIISNPDQNKVSLLIGGLVGYAYVGGTIGMTNVHTDVDIESANSNTDNVGGIAGYTSSTTTISQSSAHVTIKGGNNAGGLVGTNSGTINTSFSSGTIFGGLATESTPLLESYVGGIAGDNYGSINNSYSTAHLGVTNGVGGITAFDDFDNTSVPGQTFAGIVTNSYFAGQIFNQATGRIFTAGLVGSMNTNVTTPIKNSYWDFDAAKGAVPTDNYAKLAAVMLSSSNYTGWDFTNTWKIQNGEDFPYLAWEPAHIYISSCEQLQNMSQNLAGDYILASNIDCESLNFNPIGTSTTVTSKNPGPFTGSLSGFSSGNVHNIANFTINNKGNAAMFEYVNGANFHDLTFSNVNIQGSSTYAATLVVQTLGQTAVRNIAISSGTITGTTKTTRASGLIGYTSSTDDRVEGASVNLTFTGTPWTESGIIDTNDGTISQSISNSTFSLNAVDNGDAGLVSLNWGLIENSYASGTGNKNTSGLVDINGGKIINSYSLVSGTGAAYGFVGSTFPTSSVANSFWNTDLAGKSASGKSTSAQGTGKTTSQMQTPSTFSTWDSTYTWNIQSGQYPYFISTLNCNTTMAQYEGCSGPQVGQVQQENSAANCAVYCSTQAGASCAQWYQTGGSMWCNCSSGSVVSNPNPQAHGQQYASQCSV